MATAPLVTGDNVGIREDLSDIIALIEPDDAPCYSNARKETCSNVLYDFMTQALAAASDSNAAAEGADQVFAAMTVPTRLQQVCQILDANAQVSDTNDAVTTAGRAKESAYQIMLKAKELRRDLEKTLFAQQVKKTTDPREFGAIHAWITNASNATVQATGDGTDLPTAAVGTALTLALIDEAMENAYIDGGKPSQMYLHPRQKRIFSKLSGINNNEVNMSASSPQEGVTIGAVSIYLTDFGRLECVVDRHMPNDEVVLIDPNYFSMKNLPGRSFKQTPLAKTGSSTKAMIEYEGAPCVSAPNAHATIIGLTTTIS